VNEQPEQQIDPVSYPDVTPVPEEPHFDTKKSKTRLLAVTAVVVILIAAGAAGWFFMHKKSTPPLATKQSQKQSSAAASTPTTPADSTPVTYKSTKLNIQLIHRKDWTLKETSGGSEVILTSPPTPYSKVGGGATTGAFTLKIRMGLTATQKATVEKAIAAKDSEVIGYDAPTEQQRSYTNLSYAGGQKDAFNFLIITGSTAFKVGNPYAYTLTFDSGTFVIVGGYGADTTDSFVFDSVPASGISSTAEEQAVAIIKSLKIF